MKKPGNNLFAENGPKSKRANKTKMTIPLGGFYSTIPVKNLPGLTPEQSVTKFSRKEVKDIFNEIKRHRKEVRRG